MRTAKAIGRYDHAVPCGHGGLPRKQYGPDCAVEIGGFGVRMGHDDRRLGAASFADLHVERRDAVLGKLTSSSKERVRLLKRPLVTPSRRGMTLRMTALSAFWRTISVNS